MMKRSGGNGAVHDSPPSPKEHYVPVSNILEPTKVAWHTDQSALVGPREEEVRRHSPEGKYLYVVSAFLTIMVLWGIYRHVNVYLPDVFSSGSAGSQAVITLDQIESDPSGFRGVGSDSSALGLGGRRTAKHLLEAVLPEQFLTGERLPLRRVFRPRQVRNQNQQQEQEQSFYTRRGGSLGLRRGGST